MLKESDVLQGEKTVVKVVGGGLAGSEAAFYLAENGFKVDLYEMRPAKMTPAHKSGNLGELVCSSSLKSDNTSTAHGLLKNELRILGSLVLEAAYNSRVPGGDALCVDKEKFSSYITAKLLNHKNIILKNEEITHVSQIAGKDSYAIIATGPLTSKDFTESILEISGNDNLYFFDAIAPSVEYDSIDFSKAFMQSRYDKGEPAYINCPLNKEEYYAFIDALVSAEKTDLHLEEEKKPVYYEGCLPVEVMASRGRDTLSYGMMKPVGLTDPNTMQRPYAVLQLRQENEDGTVWGLVGFQTQLKISEQKRVFTLIPALKNARFVRYGEVHRNTYLNSPEILNEFFQMKNNPDLFFAGQITGVEGYVESSASGVVAAMNLKHHILGKKLIKFPEETLLGALQRHISTKTDNYQPMNSNFGILPMIKIRGKKADRKNAKAEIATKAMDDFIKTLD